MDNTRNLDSPPYIQIKGKSYRDSRTGRFVKYDTAIQGLRQWRIKSVRRAELEREKLEAEAKYTTITVTMRVETFGLTPSHYLRVEATLTRTIESRDNNTIEDEVDRMKWELQEEIAERFGSRVLQGLVFGEDSEREPSTIPKSDDLLIEYSHSKTGSLKKFEDKIVSSREPNSEGTQKMSRWLG